jgi:hypothetical protein
MFNLSDLLIAFQWLFLLQNGFDEDRVNKFAGALEKRGGAVTKLLDEVNSGASRNAVNLIYLILYYDTV